MATPRFDKISVELSQRIADSVASASTGGDTLTADQRTALVNEALFKLFDEGWNAVKGKIADFIELFPELLANDTITVTSGVYTINSTKLRDLYAPVNGIWGTTYVKVLAKHLYPIVKTSKFDDYIPTAANPVMFEIANTLEFFPTASFASQSVIVYYIKLPLNPTDGSFLTQNGTYDSPFADKWNSKIAEIAEDIYRTIAQEKSQ